MHGFRIQLYLKAGKTAINNIRIEKAKTRMNNEHTAKRKKEEQRKEIIKKRLEREKEIKRKGDDREKEIKEKIK